MILAGRMGRRGPWGKWAEKAQASAVQQIKSNPQKGRGAKDDLGAIPGATLHLSEDQTHHQLRAASAETGRGKADGLQDLNVRDNAPVPTPFGHRGRGVRAFRSLQRRAIAAKLRQGTAWRGNSLGHSYQCLEVKPAGEHLQLALRGARPVFLRSIPIKLHTVIVGIA